jgi:hypothetical protein
MALRAKFGCVFFFGVLLSACVGRKSDSSNLTSENSSVINDMLSGLVLKHSKLDAKFFENFNIGPTSAGSSFPKAYLAVPPLSGVLGDEDIMTVTGTVKSSTTPFSLAMVYSKGGWTDGTNAIPVAQTEIGLANYPYATIDIDVTSAQSFTRVDWHTQTESLSPGKVINPFLGVNVVRIDPSSMKWIQSFNDKSNSLFTKICG